MTFLKVFLCVCVKKNSQNHDNEMVFTQYTKKLN